MNFKEIQSDSGFKNNIHYVLSNYNHRSIFSLFFNEVDESMRYCNPLRDSDKTPGCFFKEHNGVLYFVDNSSDSFYNGKIVNYYNAAIFAVLYYRKKIGSATEATILSKVRKQKKVIEEKKEVNKQQYSKVDIFYDTKPYDKNLDIYLSTYGLKIDFNDIIIIDSYYVRARKSFARGNCIATYGLIYEDKIKIIQPYENLKFITNFEGYEVLFLDRVNYDLDYIIVTKSYKEYKTCCEAGYTNVVVISSESIKPFMDLYRLLYYFSYIYFLFDTDNQGEKARKSWENFGNTNRPLGNRSVISSLIVPTYGIKQITDLSDLSKYKSLNHSKLFLIQNLKNHEQTIDSQ